MGPVSGLAQITVNTQSLELDYAEVTANATITDKTTDGTAQALVTGAAVVYDGVTRVKIEFFCPCITTIGAGHTATIIFRDNDVSIGDVAVVRGEGGPCLAELYRTPSAGSHAFSAALFSDVAGAAYGNAGAASAADTFAPMWMRVTRA